MGIPVSALHCNNRNKEFEINDIHDGLIKIIYMSPEYMAEGDGLELTRKLVKNNQLGFLAIDESHCLSSWGHDFRPSYLKLQIFREHFPEIPIMAVTATAKEVVVKEIISILKLNKPEIIRANFDRPNLFIQCKPIGKERIKGKEKQITYDKIIREYINKYPNERIIIYVNSRKKTEELTEKINLFFNDENICAYYHAGLTKNKRESVQENFIKNTCKVIISTIAFGMGIDQIVRCVLVFGCPTSIEEYWQQIGRGGRDGLPCETIFYYDKSAFVIATKMIDSEPNKILVKMKKNNLQKVNEYYETKKCRRQYILEYLGLSKSYFAYNGFTCSNCDNCLNYNLVDITHYIWEAFIENKPLKESINNIINDNEFKLNKILKDWKSYIEFKKYTQDNLPDNLKIKLIIGNIIDQNDIIFDKFDKILL
jgi:RecQ family ATP-dependent DNA helicase